MPRRRRPRDGVRPPLRRLIGETPVKVVPGAGGRVVARRHRSRRPRRLRRRRRRATRRVVPQVGLLPRGVPLDAVADLDGPGGDRGEPQRPPQQRRNSLIGGRARSAGRDRVDPDRGADVGRRRAARALDLSRLSPDAVRLGRDHHPAHLHLSRPGEDLPGRGAEVARPREVVRRLPLGDLPRRVLVVHAGGREPEGFLEHPHVGAGVSEAHVAHGEPHRGHDVAARGWEMGVVRVSRGGVHERGSGVEPWEIGPADVAATIVRLSAERLRIGMDRGTGTGQARRSRAKDDGWRDRRDRRREKKEIKFQPVRREPGVGGRSSRSGDAPKRPSWP